MFCMKCGNKIDDDSKFCPFCGGAVRGVMSANGQAAGLSIDVQLPNMAGKSVLK